MWWGKFTQCYCSRCDCLTWLCSLPLQSVSLTSSLMKTVCVFNVLRTACLQEVMPTDATVISIIQPWVVIRWQAGKTVSVRPTIMWIVQVNVWSVQLTASELLCLQTPVAHVWTTVELLVGWHRHLVLGVVVSVHTYLDGKGSSACNALVVLTILYHIGVPLCLDPLPYVLSGCAVDYFLMGGSCMACPDNSENFNTTSVSCVCKGNTRTEQQTNTAITAGCTSM